MQFNFIVLPNFNVLNQGSDENIRLLVLGMPNVGKSSLINALRRTYLRKGVYIKF